MFKILIPLVVVVIAISMIGSFFLVWYIMKRKQKSQESDFNPREQNDRKDLRSWIVLITFGFIFSMIPAAGLIFQSLRTQDWVEIPAVVSEMRTRENGTKKVQYIFVSYEFNGQTFENIDTNTTVQQGNAKNQTNVGQEIVILVNPNAPSQIVASNNFFYGILFALLMIGLLICFFGTFNLIMTWTGKSKWRTTADPPVMLTEEETSKSRISAKIFVAVIFCGLLLFIYFVFSLRIFLFFVGWMMILAVYGMYKHKKETRNDGK